MTALCRSFIREVPAYIRDKGKLRPIVVELVPGDPCLYLRQKGSRHRYALPYESAYLKAVTLEVERLRREKKAKRRTKQ